MDIHVQSALGQIWCNRAGKAWRRVLVLGLLLWWGTALCTAGELPEQGRTWKYVSELSEEEQQRIDLRTETPRGSTVPYLPAEPYPFSPPYTAEEKGFLSTEFSHVPR